MANNRVALRDLQARLAQRLETARGTGVVTGWLAVETGAQGFLFPLTQAGEIFPWTAQQRVPYTQPWFQGVSNLRGGLYGVVDVHHFLFDKPTPGRNEFSRTQSRLVAFNAALEVNCVLLVDKLAGLRNVQSFVHELATEQDKPSFYGAVLVDESGRRWQEINLQRLAQDSRFLSVAVSDQGQAIH